MAIRNDPYAPYYELIIGGAKMDDNFMKLVSEVSFEDEALMISSLKFKVKYRRNIKGGTSDDILNMKALSPGNLVILRGGYGSDIKDIGAGYIMDLDPDFSDNADPTVSVTCYDQLQKLSLRKSEKGEVFKNFRDSQICSILGERNGFYIRIADASTWFGIRKTTGKKVRTIKRGASDLDMLKELAKLNSFDLYCKWMPEKKRFNLFFEPPKDRTKQVVKYVYGSGDVPVVPQDFNGEVIGKLVSFNPKFSVTTQFTRYKVFSWDKKAARKISYTLSMDEFMAGQEDLKIGGNKSDTLLKKNAATSGAGVRKKAFGEVTEIIGKRLFTSEADAKNYLIMHMKKMAKDFIKGSGKAAGNQYLQSRQVHEFEGLGAMFSGKYFMDKVTHKFSPSGYNCTFNARRVLRELI